jgi:broad specificity phosphatase PhoE
MEQEQLTNSKVEELQTKSQVLMIRHGKSVANVEYANVSEKDESLILHHWRLNKDLRDSRLAPLGIEQSKNAGIIMNQIKVHTVLVSPLRRTLETAYYIFKEHPDFSKIKFIVVPNLRESMNTSSDIPENFENVRDEFSKIFPHLDYSLMDDYKNQFYYYLEDMSQEYHDKIIKQLHHSEINDYIDPMDVLLEEIKLRLPEQNESRWNALARAKNTKEFIKNYLSENDIPFDEKVVLVTHYVYCYMHTGKWYKEYSRDEALPHPDEYFPMDNCDIVNDPTDYAHL